MAVPSAPGRRPSARPRGHATRRAEPRSTKSGEYRLVRRAARPNEGVVDWLLTSPEKGFFVPVPSESTEKL